MKKLLLALFLLLPVHALADAKVGEPAPEFAAKDTKGKPQSVAQYKGRILVLEWTNPECPFVKKHYGSGNMQDTQVFARENDAVWISVVSSAPGKQGHMTAAIAAQVAAEQKSKADAIILDETGVIGKAYGAKTTPHIFIIDANGILVYQGAIDSIPSGNASDIEKATNFVKQAVEELIAGKPITSPVTQPYGCSVKY